MVITNPPIMSNEIVLCEPSERGSMVMQIVDETLIKFVISVENGGSDSLILRKSQPLGLLTPLLPAEERLVMDIFPDICNRLKILAGLNPVVYREPVRGNMTLSFILPREQTAGAPREVSLSVYFDDRCEDPYCRIEQDR